MDHTTGGKQPRAAAGPNHLARTESELGQGRARDACEVVAPVEDDLGAREEGTEEANAVDHLVDRFRVPNPRGVDLFEAKNPSSRRRVVRSYEQAPGAAQLGLGPIGDLHARRPAGEACHWAVACNARVLHALLGRDRRVASLRVGGGSAHCTVRTDTAARGTRSAGHQ